MKCCCPFKQLRELVFQCERDWLEHARAKGLLARYVTLVATGAKASWGLCPQCDQRLREQVLAKMFAPPVTH